MSIGSLVRVFKMVPDRFFMRVGVPVSFDDWVVGKQYLTSQGRWVKIISVSVGFGSRVRVLVKYSNGAVRCLNFEHILFDFEGENLRVC